MCHLMKLLILKRNGVIGEYFMCIDGILKSNAFVKLRLVSKRQMDASISHYIEAGATVKALEAAVGAKQWRKAVQVCHI